MTAIVEDDNIGIIRIDSQREREREREVERCDSV
jgi:hypothetical protein